MKLIDADELKLSHCKECTLYPNQCLKDNCDWDSIYHIKIAKTVEAIPIEWIEEWLKNMPKHTTPYFYKRFLRNAIRGMVKDWRKENE